MARDVFDIYDDKEPQIATGGVEFASLEAVRKEAQRPPPDIARSEILEDGPRSWSGTVRASSVSAP